MCQDLPVKVATANECLSAKAQVNGHRLRIRLERSVGTSGYFGTRPKLTLNKLKVMWPVVLRKQSLGTTHDPESAG
jgi:hypothetical protein